MMDSQTAVVFVLVAILAFLWHCTKRLDSDIEIAYLA